MLYHAETIVLGKELTIDDVLDGVTLRPGRKKVSSLPKVASPRSNVFNTLEVSAILMSPMSPEIIAQVTFPEHLSEEWPAGLRNDFVRSKAILIYDSPLFPPLFTLQQC
jgi:hypothetical protein